ncbi:MAG: hypothetical protein KDE33_00585 [Bacteroidetes bacterium]|nr:hypothetical protein [Bacteroidota bacterium]
MKYLVIITTRDFSQLWNNQTDFTDTDRTVYILDQGEGRSEKPLTDFPTIITNKINGNIDFELGVIFHKLNGDLDADTLRESLKTAFNSKLAFCEWYSSNKTDFWNETDANAELPYNNLKKAWKDNNGDKAETFEAVWDYFLGDTEEEALTEAIFSAIYEHKNEDEIENLVNVRDRYIKGKNK